MCRLTLAVHELLTSRLKAADITTEKPIDSPAIVSTSVNVIDAELTSIPAPESYSSS